MQPVRSMRLQRRESGGQAAWRQDELQCGWGLAGPAVLHGAGRGTGSDRNQTKSLFAGRK